MESKKIAKISLLTMLILMLAVQVGFSQKTGLLKGQISDKANVGIDWAQVIVTKDAENRAIQVDKEGKYELALPEGEYILIGQAKAFRSSEGVKVTIHAGQTTEINLSLDVNLDNAVCILRVEGDIKKDKVEDKEKTGSPKNKGKEKPNKPQD